MMCEYCQKEKYEESQQIGKVTIEHNKMLINHDGERKGHSVYAQIHQYADGFYLDVDYMRVKIKFCPICGRKLGDD